MSNNLRWTEAELRAHESRDKSQPAKRHKYNAVATMRGAIRFASKAEARRFDELVLLEREYKIFNLRLQPRFQLQESYMRPDGTKVPSIFYTPDFIYEDPFAYPFVARERAEDVKGRDTDASRVRRNMFMAKYPQIELRIIR